MKASDRSESRKAVAISAIGFGVHCLLLSAILFWGDSDEAYFPIGDWAPGPIEVSVLHILTWPIVLNYLLRKPSVRSRKLLLIPAVLHFPFIHFGIFLSLTYFASIAHANALTRREAKVRLLKEALQRVDSLERQQAHHSA